MVFNFFPEFLYKITDNFQLFVSNSETKLVFTKGESLEVIPTPGHTKDSVSLKVLTPGER